MSYVAGHVSTDSDRCLGCSAGWSLIVTQADSAHTPSIIDMPLTPTGAPTLVLKACRETASSEQGLNSNVFCGFSLKYGLHRLVGSHENL